MLSSSSNKRIAENTLALYLRMVIIMLVSLYTSRIVLQVLGEEDFGIHNVVGGVVSLIGILNASLSSSTQRFLNFSLGNNNPNDLIKVFSTSFILYCSLCIILLIISETVGLWFVNTKLTIPNERIYAANWVYQCSVLSCIISLLSNPYMACILAHERMNVYAYISLAEVFLKLSLLLLLYYTNFDKLITYSILLLICHFITTLLYISYCIIKYEKTRVNFVKDRTLMKKMLSFSGWNILGSGSDIIKTHGTSILLNIFFSPIVNAAQAIAVQVDSAVRQFYSNFYKAVYPQIVKNYAGGDYSNLYKLVLFSSKFSFFLILFISLPIIIETPYMIKSWLGNVPEYTVSFIRIIICISAFDALSSPMMSTANATGQIALYQSTMGGLKLLNLPISYMCLRMGMPPVSVFIIALSIAIVAYISRIFILFHILPTFPIKSYIKEVFLRCAIVGMCSSILPIAIYNKIDNTIVYNIIFMTILCFCLTILSIWHLGLCHHEKVKVIMYIKHKVSKINKGIK